jgi:hypothetical protein
MSRASKRALKRFGLACATVLSLAAISCGILPQQGDGDAGATDAGPTATAAADGAPIVSGMPMGAGCGQEQTTGVTLCRAMSLCPSLTVDPDAFPDCGFRVSGDIIDLECACNGSLCPMGTATTCSDAAQLMQTQSELAVCAQVSEGRCSGGVPMPTPSSTAPSGCDATCRDMCAGDPSCYKICGC